MSVTMDAILKQYDKLLISGNEEDRRQLYKILSEFKCGSDDLYYLFQYILPKIYELFHQQKLQKEFVYLSFIAVDNLEQLRNFIKYDKSVLKLNVEDPISLFNYTLYKGQHWFEQVIKYPEEYETIFGINIYNKLVLLRCLQLTNSSKFYYDKIVNLVNKINADHFEDFWKNYIEQIKYFIHITEICFRNQKENTTRQEIFSYVSSHTALETLSYFTRLRNVNNSDILELINNEETITRNQDMWKFYGFDILANLLDCITLEPSQINIGIITSNIKEKIMAIAEKYIQINVLKCIFSLIFIQTSHLKNVQFDRKYICQNKDIRMLVYLMKDILDDIMLAKDYNKQSDQFEEISNLKILVTDAIWRMDIITNVKEEGKCNKNLLAYMLSSPESLIQMCLKCHDLERAYQVIKISNLQDELLPKQIEYSEKLHNLRESLRQKFRVKTIQLENPALTTSTLETSIEQIFERFFKNYSVPTCLEIDSLLREGANNKRFFVHFKNDTFLNMLDVAITQVTHFDDCRRLLHLTFSNSNLDPDVSSAFSKFCTKITDTCNSIGSSKNICAAEILVSRLFVDPNTHATKEDFFKHIIELYDEMNGQLESSEQGILNSNHASHKTFQKLNNVCKDFVQTYASNIEHVMYLSKFFNYLKAFSRILYIEENNSDIVSKDKNSSYFDLIAFNRSELIGKLVFERKMSPGEFEKYFAVLKLDYLYHIIGNCFPTINLHTQENVTKEELYPDNYMYIPEKGIIAYIQKRNWLLAFLLNEIYKVDDVKIDVSQVRVKVFSNYLNLKRHEYLKDLYEQSLIVTALQNDIGYQKVSNYINSKIVKEDVMQLSVNSNDSFETGEEIVEGILQTVNWKALEDLLKSIPESHMKKHSGFMDLRDKILVKIIHDSFEIDYYNYVRYIGDTDQRITTILECMRKWPASFCVKVIKAEITRRNCVRHPKLEELQLWLSRIRLSEKVMKLLNQNSWSKAYDLSESKPQLVIEKLMETREVDDLMNFIYLHKPNNELFEKINETYILAILDNSDNHGPIKKLLDILPHDHSMDLCYNLLKVVRNLNFLQFVVNYMLQYIDNDSLKKASISLKMLEGFTKCEQDQLLCLIYSPLNIVEVLIMNTKLDRLASVLSLLKSISPDTDLLDKVDGIIRNYAEKSLDFRIITQPNPRLLRTPECKLMQSLDSLLDNRPFVMPDDIPTKEEWVDNNEIVLCMSCQKTTFSMFNRRHHCRRCGRVVCYYCSIHRMLKDVTYCSGFTFTDQIDLGASLKNNEWLLKNSPSKVPTYGDILVRVCKDCYEQTLGEEGVSEKNDTISTKSNTHDFWLLTDDNEHNRIVREEFSYDHAPSVSLCLSLMKYHSKNCEYPKFLLNQCDALLKLLIPTQEPTQEIDYFLVIKMLKSLTVAAKVSSSDCNFTQGTSLADHIISQTELLGLLAERGCLNMLPIASTHSQGSPVDASILRKLRDRLLEREQWNLALDVSTKAGLDNAGIFAAWGKSCLKAGSLILAREKFQRCMDKGFNCDSLMDSSTTEDSFDGMNKSRTTIKSKNMLSDTKTLLEEIIVILESNSQIVGDDVMKELQKQKLSASITTLNQSFNYCVQDTASCVLTKLKNLKNISEGNYNQTREVNTEVVSLKAPLNKTFFDECVYYLRSYGTSLKLIEFYIKHGHFENALKYISDNKVSNEIFVDIYMRCLKDGIVLTLQENMSKIDGSLEEWKDHIRFLCRHLEKQNMLHSLYQLQQYMGDYIRAAMTCVRFYTENVYSFTDLANNINFLVKAEEHLRYCIEQDQWTEIAPVRKSSVSSEECFEEKGIVNPSIVMKMSPKDVYKHIHTMHLQNEVSRFLSDCESFEMKPLDILATMEVPDDSEKAKREAKPAIITLFGTMVDKFRLAVLAIVCGLNVSDGFDISQRLIQEFKLRPIKIYCEAGKQLAKAERYSGIAQLVSCINQSGTTDSNVTEMCDEMLMLAVATFTKANVLGTKVEELIKLISDKSAKISAYIEAKQLKTAYFLAVKYKRMSDIRRISREAELLNQPGIKTLCQKILQSHSHSSTLCSD